MADNVVIILISKKQNRVNAIVIGIFAGKGPLTFVIECIENLLDYFQYKSFVRTIYGGCECL